MIFCLLPFLCFFVFLPSSRALAETKVFSGGGDGTKWTDNDNWFSVGIPAAADDVTINVEDAAVVVDNTFSAQSVVIGGKETSGMTVQNFVFGTIAPVSSSSDAIHIRKDGTLDLQGSGTITVRGAFKNSEEGVGDEPSVMILLE